MNKPNFEIYSKRITAIDRASRAIEKAISLDSYNSQYERALECMRLARSRTMADWENHLRIWNENTSKNEMRQ